MVGQVRSHAHKFAQIVFIAQAVRKYCDLNDLHGMSCLTRLNASGNLANMPEVVLLTTSEVAKRFRVDSSAVRRWVSENRLTPTITTPGGHYRFSETDIDAFAAQQATA